MQLQKAELLCWGEIWLEGQRRAHIVACSVWQFASDSDSAELVVPGKS